MPKYLSNNEVLMECPDCGKEKLYFNTAKQVGWCHYCQVAYRNLLVPGEGWVGDLLGMTDLPSYLEVQHDELAIANGPLWDYLQARGVTGEEAIKIPIKVTAMEHLSFPITSPSPDIKPSYIIRDTEKNDWRIPEGTERRHLCFGWEVIPSHHSRIVLVEGIFSLLTPGLYGYGIAMLGKVLPEVLLCHLEKNYRQVFLWMDNDQAGRRAEKVIERQLQQAGLVCHILRDPNAEEGTDPGDYPRDHAHCKDLREILEGKREIPGNSRYPLSSED